MELVSCMQSYPGLVEAECGMQLDQLGPGLQGLPGEEAATEAATLVAGDNSSKVSWVSK